MYIDDLVREYPEEIKALCVQTDISYSLREILELMDRCQSYRERRELEQRIQTLEDRLKALEDQFWRRGEYVQEMYDWRLNGDKNMED